MRLGRSPPLPFDPRAPLIRMRGVEKRFDERAVLAGIDLVVERGEIAVVIGGSGTGKTTLARLVIGLERPTAGSVAIEGVEVASLGDRELTTLRRRFAMVFQHDALLDSLSVFDNVAFPLREETELDERAIAERVHAVLAELGVDEAADKFPAELSGGMAKRVGIARAMVVEPEILVYDEPTSGLDPVTSRTVDALIERMRDEHLVTSLVITHDMLTAYAIADRIVLLEHGKIAADGDPLHVLESHDEAVRSFASSSGIDLEHLPARSARPSAAEIRARWEAAHPRQRVA